MSKHARTTITVPADLRARMDAVGEDVNWSALACQAFEQKLAEIIKRKGTSDMTEVVDRLRVSKCKFESEQYQTGHQAGQAWAKDTAEVVELIRLEYWRNQYASDWDRIFQDSANVALPAADYFVSAIQAEPPVKRRDVRDFWESVDPGTPSPVGEFVHGFADGALSVWDKVKDQL